MRILLLFDSKFGNTEKAAKAVEAALVPAKHKVKLVFAPTVKTDPSEGEKYDVLIVASPTHDQSASASIKAAVAKLEPANWKGATGLAISTDYRRVIEANEPSAVHWIQQNLAEKGLNLVDLLFRIPVEGLKGPMDERVTTKVAKEIAELLKQLKPRSRV